MQAASCAAAAAARRGHSAAQRAVCFARVCALTRRAPALHRSAKLEKPSLGGTRFRQRKRNINVPLDHTSFADDVVAIFQDAAVDGADVESNLVRRAARAPAATWPLTRAARSRRQLAGVKALEVHGADLDYSRYGDTLFELLFTGGRFAGGSMELEYGESKLATNVRGAARRRGPAGLCPRKPFSAFWREWRRGGASRAPRLSRAAATQVFACAPEVVEIKPYVVAMQHILRCARRGGLRAPRCAARCLACAMRHARRAASRATPPLASRVAASRHGPRACLLSAPLTRTQPLFPCFAVALRFFLFFSIAAAPSWSRTWRTR
jgi:hypothetical protein